MKKIVISLFTLASYCMISHSQEISNSPRIIKTIPAFGDCNVDPELKEIVIVFDQDMQNGSSVVDSKDEPKIINKLSWKDKRTFIIPVKLYSDKMYYLIFNDQRFNNFKNADGIPLQPDELLFKTQPKDYKLLNFKAFNELSTYFPSYYSYADRKNIDWKNEFVNRKKDFQESNSNVDFAIILSSILKKADDPYLWCELKGQQINSGRKKIVTPNYAQSNYIFNKLKDQKFINSFEFTGGKINNIGYVSIKSWEFEIKNLKLNCWGFKDSVLSISNYMKEIMSLPNIIIDVRQNSGGNEKFAKYFASFFITDSVPYEKIILRDSVSGKYNIEKTKWLYPNHLKLNYKGNIYVLSGPDVMSSNESFILMMKQIKNSKIVGMKTYGSSGNPQPVELSNEIKIYIPSWKAYTLDGVLIEGNGIKPDIEITTKDSKQNNLVSEKVDSLFENVLELIKK